MLTPEQVRQFHEQGFVLVDGVLSADEVALLTGTLEAWERAGDRGVQGVRWSDELITTIETLPLQDGPLPRVIEYRPVVELVEQLVGGPVRVTGGLLLDKDPRNNWDIAWHQDNGIYVAETPAGEREDVRGGLPVLSTTGMELGRNVTCRLALDDSGPDNGGLYVLPGSHRTNLQPAADVKDRFKSEPGVCIAQQPGSMLCYAPLLLHRSEKSKRDTGRRRVLHLQYGPADLMLPGTNCYPFPQPVPLTKLASLTEH